jgi:hypothetical protein
LNTPFLLVTNLDVNNPRNGGTHVHSVWRDFAQDFGYNLA